MKNPPRRKKRLTACHRRIEPDRIHNKRNAPSRFLIHKKRSALLSISRYSAFLNNSSPNRSHCCIQSSCRKQTQKIPSKYPANARRRIKIPGDRIPLLMLTSSPLLFCLFHLAKECLRLPGNPLLPSCVSQSDCKGFNSIYEKHIRAMPVAQMQGLPAIFVFVAHNGCHCLTVFNPSAVDHVCKLFHRHGLHADKFVLVQMLAAGL